MNNLQRFGLALAMSVALPTLSHAGAYVDGTLAAAFAEDADGDNADGGSAALHGGYAFAPYFALGARLEADVLEDDLGSEVTALGFFIEGTLSTNRYQRAYGYLALGVGILDVTIENSDFGVDDDDSTQAASAEFGVLINTGRLGGNHFQIGPFVRYTYLDEVFGVDADVLTAGLRLGWNGN